VKPEEFDAALCEILTVCPSLSKLLGNNLKKDLYERFQYEDPKVFTAVCRALAMLFSTLPWHLLLALLDYAVDKKPEKREITYDENAPCRICGEPVLSASTSGTDICPWCDMGRCRYCGIPIFPLKAELDGGRSMKEIRRHIEWHKRNSAMKEAVLK